MMSNQGRHDGEPAGAGRQGQEREGVVMLKLPWMQFYPADWMRDTACLSLAARGAWITITCNLWGAPERGRLSMPLPAWGRILGVSAKSAGRSIEELSARGICECVTECNGDVTLVSRRMVRDEKAREATRYRVKRYRNAHGTPPCNGLVTAQKSEVRSQKSESEEEKKKETPPPAAVCSAFDEFWKSYPRKTGKGAARKVWAKAKLDGNLAVILAAVARQKGTEQWRKEGGQFIPHPATWLRQERWEDEGLSPPTARATVPAESARARHDRALREIDMAIRHAEASAVAHGDVDRAVDGLRDKYRDQPAALREALEIWQFRQRFAEALP